MSLDLTTVQKALTQGSCRLTSLPPSAQAWLGCLLIKEEKCPQLWVVDHIHTLEKLASCFQCFCPKTHLLCLPPFDPKDMDTQSQRLKTLSFLENDQTRASSFILLTTFQTLEEPLPTIGKPLIIKCGTIIDPDRLVLELDQQGFVLEAEVYEKGRAARRGGILDVWPPASELPVRIEFFGNEIDSLRTFEPESQCSIKKTDRVEIYPLNSSGDATLEELLPENTLKIFSHCEAPADAHCIKIGELTTDTTEIGIASYDTNLKPVSKFNRPDMAEQQRKTFFQTLEGMVSKGWTVDVYMETSGTLARLKETYIQHSSLNGHPSFHLRLGLLHGSFVCKQDQKLVITESEIYGYAPKTAHSRKKQSVSQAPGARVADWADIQPGELVVHADHGIGKYLGLMEIEMAGRGQEMLLLEYAEGAKIYLPTGQAHLLTRYTGIGNTAPSLHALKGKRWQNERASAQTAIEDLAANLLETQAVRAMNKGRPCGPDTHLQGEFENAFPYMETPDQLKAIRDVKGELESAQSMDRLICGDAGYGKTEVAMRAAFKMVMEGRQVALLVPTTVLAQQHYDTFTERMAAFPVQVEMLSRFRTRHEQNETIQRLREGETHIVIGTHRLVSGDVRFKDLGLVIIDEEQRFGVRAKEYLKKIRQQVDVLTMSATPIPRTLYMSLTGARDMSTIQTPPQERQPIETVVLQYHEEIVREAILHEMARDGQVFYLHNRVQTIAGIAATLKELVPEARIEFAHGQMSERELSEVMHRFVHGTFDVLLSTTIIESGVDVPRANTIIIDRADRFGLSDLYQLRGRVGRARQKAYAFLLLPEHGHLNDTARQRIEALKQFGGLGAGFRIAMRDLEIRGAGNLLGAQQSGHIAAIGFDLYCQLLKRSVAKLAGKRMPPIVDAAVELDFIERAPSGALTEDAAFIPYNYVDDENLRVKLYGRLASLATETEVRELRKEFIDRFGRPPAAVKNLFEIARIRIAAAAVNVKSVRSNEERLIFMRNQEAIMPNGRYPRLTAEKTSAKLKEILSLLKSLKR